MTLTAFVCPPLFFAQRREWASVVINGFLYLCSVLMVIAGLGAMMIHTDSAGAGLLIVSAFVWWLLCLAHVLETRRRDRAKARAALEPPPHANSRKGVKAAVFLASFVATMVLLEAAFTSTGTQTGPNPFPLFPVVVVTRSTGGDAGIHLVYYKDLDEFCRKHSGATYLVPPGEAERLRVQLNDGSFAVTQLANGRQAFKVWKTVHPEAHITGWYEASEKELFPSRYRLFHDMMRVIFFFPALVVGLVTTLIAGKLLPRIGRGATDGTRVTEPRPRTSVG
jgi:hypothetical protein